jgi:carboxypeptidase family protein
MFARAGVIAAISAAFILTCNSLSADTKAIQGTVIGLDGKPMAGADIRADRLDSKAQPAVTKTDAQGHYVFRSLPVGAYAVTAFVKSVPKSRGMVKTRADGWAKVDFDLRIKPNDPSIKKKYVWVNGEPGSHIGGRWVEVDQANTPSTSAVDTVNTNDVHQMQRNMQMNSNMSFPGR